MSPSFQRGTLGVPDPLPVAGGSESRINGERPLQSLRSGLLVAAGLVSIATAAIIAILADYERTTALGMLVYIVPLALVPFVALRRGTVFRAITATTTIVTFFLSVLGFVALAPLCVLHLAASLTPQPAGMHPHAALRSAILIIVVAALYAVTMPFVTEDDRGSERTVTSRLVTP